jgi:alpha-glucosidase
MRTERLTPAWIRANQAERLAALPSGAWPCNTLGNHDTSRMRSRYGDGVHDEALARVNLALMLTLKGTPFLYNGEEIGMVDYYLTDLNDFRDPPAVWQYQAELAEGTPPAEALDIAAHHSRDRCRTPMQWANAANAGFSPAGVTTWLPVNPDYGQGVNVAEQLTDPASLLGFYRSLLQVRRLTPALISGEYEPLNAAATGYLAFLRHSAADKQTCVVVLNYSDEKVTVKLEVPARTARCLFSTSTSDGAEQDLQALTLDPFGVYIGALMA